MIAEENLRTLALTLPGVAQVPDWGCSRFHVRRRTFMTLNGVGNRAAVRLPLADWLSLALPRTGPYRGVLRPRVQPGWVVFDPAQVSAEAARRCVHAAWRHAAHPAPGQRPRQPEQERTA
ncbi:hypothetical protein [Streptomyces sp. NPDC048637]|uniref:hypothetical protein n=1 Tax=Streptomyces sp. NPDC048637 TaxID=3155636 RepID=UPI003424B41E